MPQNTYNYYISCPFHLSISYTFLVPVISWSILLEPRFVVYVCDIFSVVAMTMGYIMYIDMPQYMYVYYLHGPSVQVT